MGIANDMPRFRIRMINATFESTDDDQLFIEAKNDRFAAGVGHKADTVRGLEAADP